jgi:ADP-L-glycero-D-manno-heptose 6-epimerase
MRILVTGGAGFIGAALAKKFVADGHAVVIADDFSSGRWTNLIDYPGDVRTLDVAAGGNPLRASGPFDMISHQASITDTTVMDQHRMMHNNVEGFRIILDLACQWGSRVVWASSASIYGQGPAPMKESQPPSPLNVYAYSKLAMERLAEQFVPRLAHPIVGLRYFNVFGPGEAHKGKFSSMIGQLARQMKAGQRPRIFTAGQQKRDFVYIADVVAANMLAMKSTTSGIFNVGSGAAGSFNEVVAQLNRVLKTDLSPDYFENPYSFCQDWTQADLTRSTQLLGYQPAYPLAKGIEAYHASGAL